MDRRVFQIDRNCFIIYTGQSSADDCSFLRIGNSDVLDKNIQSRVGFIVIPDASKIDYSKEKQNIRFTPENMVHYICNRENQDILFQSLKDQGVDTTHLYHKDLSKDLDNVSRIENKKHFFTIFYENKNVKIVSEEVIYFDLFAAAKSSGADFSAERARLEAFINKMEELKELNRNRAHLKKLAQSISAKEPDKDSKYTLFLIQDKLYIPLNVKMFRYVNPTTSGIRLICNSSFRLYTGGEAALVVLLNGKEDASFKGTITEGSVVESEILYDYKIDFTFKDNPEAADIVTSYKSLFN